MTLLGLLRLGRGLPSVSVLTPEEEARWRRIARPERAAQYLAGRWLLRRLCADHSGTRPEDWTLNAAGAPQARGPGGVSMGGLSLAHSGEWLAAAAAGEPVGVDVEALGRVRPWEGLGQALGLDPPYNEDTVLRYWTRHEAEFKAGTGGGRRRCWRFRASGLLGYLVAQGEDEARVRIYGELGPGEPFVFEPAEAGEGEREL